MCLTFKEMPRDKISTLKSNNLCLNCFKPGHFSRQCPNTHKCKKCQRAHSQWFKGIPHYLFKVKHLLLQQNQLLLTPQLDPTFPTHSWWLAKLGSRHQMVLQSKHELYWTPDPQAHLYLNVLCNLLVSIDAHNIWPCLELEVYLTNHQWTLFRPLKSPLCTHQMPSIWSLQSLSHMSLVTYLCNLCMTV